MLQNIEVIELRGTELEENETCLDYLDQTGKSITFDFEREEMIFFLSNQQVIVLDFDNICLHKLSESQFLDLYDKFGSEELPQMYQEYLNILSVELNTDVYFVGSGDYRVLIIKIFDSYFSAFNILIDIDDNFDPHDPDDGESILGSFFYFLNFASNPSKNGSSVEL
jgi:hypothetical protein